MQSPLTDKRGAQSPAHGNRGAAFVKYSRKESAIDCLCLILITNYENCRNTLDCVSHVRCLSETYTRFNSAFARVTHTRVCEFANVLLEFTKSSAVFLHSFSKHIFS